MLKGFKGCCSILYVLVLVACQPPKSDDAKKEDVALQNDDGSFNITVNNEQCEPMSLTVPSGKLTFHVHNNSNRKLEWEILKGVMVVEERENIAPTLKSTLTATLLPGEYEMTCGLLTNPHGKLIVKDSGFVVPESSADFELLEAPLAAYKKYTQKQVNDLVAATTEFVAAVKADDINRARDLFAATRVYYERIEPIAELFNELDPVIDAREDDFKEGAADPNFIGFHRIEYALWIENDTKSVHKTADQLLADVKKLKTEIDALSFPPNKVVGGAADLIEEVAGSKISGEEDRYSHTDLSDFQANVDGAQKVVDLFRPMITAKNPALINRIDDNFKTVNDILLQYRTKTGFEDYDQLSDEHRKALQAPVTQLAEDLSKLRGTLGLN